MIIIETEDALVVESIRTMLGISQFNLQRTQTDLYYLPDSIQLADDIVTYTDIDKEDEE